MPTRLVLSFLATVIGTVILNWVGNHVDLFWGVVLTAIWAVVVLFLALTDEWFAGLVFGRFGGKHPMILIAVSAVAGATIFGAGAAILNRHYQKRSTAATPSTAGPVAPSTPAPIAPLVPAPVVDASKSRPSENSVKKKNTSEQSPVSIHQESKGANSPNVVTFGGQIVRSP